MINTTLGRIVLGCAAATLVYGCMAAPDPVAPTPAAQPAAARGDAATAAAPSPVRDAAQNPAPDGPEPVVIGHRKTIRSTILGEDRTYLVHLPRSYQVGNAGYPVMYLLDGEGHFHHTTGLVAFLANQQRMPEMIVVAVGNTDRTRDMTPTRNEEFPTSGGADAFLKFLDQELTPAINREYRTVPYRMLVGHSFGGLFAIHALTASPDSFQAVVSISPSLWWEDQLMLRKAKKLFAARRDLTGFLYITLGNEPDRMLTSNRAFAEMLEAKAPSGLAWKFTLLENEDHGSVPHRSTYLALEALFADWRLPEEVATLGAAEAHYARLSKRLRYDVAIPENTLNLFGYKLLGAGKPDEAIAAFKRNIELYPESANVYDSLGEAYEKSGDVAAARENYAIAVRKASAGANPFLAVYENNLARVSGSTER